VSDPALDTLAESARNRGLKLVRSRVRTAGKRRFGKVGLTDSSGKPVFGMDSKGPTAKPEEVEDFLRNLGARDWGASLNVAVLPRKRTGRSRAETRSGRASAEIVQLRPKQQAKPKAAPKPKPPPPPPKPMVREAKPGDAPRLVELIRFLAGEVDVKSAVDEKSVRKNLTTLKKLGELPLVATLGKQVVGLIGRHKMVSVHRTAPLGRIPILVVAEGEQRQGIGRMLVEAVEEWCRKGGCQFVEVTSNDQLGAAHAFYRHMGYERTSIRFMKKL
jgi:GNAT superfamily N-acetyltransferase